jgi:hypothetical protein
MAFPLEPTRTPIAIRDISIDLFDPDPLGEGVQAVRYSVQIAFDDGSIVVRVGNLVPQLTPAQTTQLQTFMADMRTKAEMEFLP